MKKIFLLFFLALAGMIQSNALKAQTVTLYDLNPRIYSDSSLVNESMLRLNISVKMQNVEQADSVFFMLGSVANASDAGMIKGKILSTGTYFYASVGPDQFPVTNNELNASILLALAQFQATRFISMRVKDVTGNVSNIVSLRIN
ncbi:MAG: hypothetical protein JWP12_1536 [Bacteroidetes bacterium]|nr:hypothetical protein [Bacteroidota bacterium]